MKFALLLFSVAFASAKRGGILMPDGDILHYESVTNENDNTELLTFGTKNLPGYLNGIKFHDFNTGYIASKLVDHGLCLISAIKYKKPTYITERLVKYPPVVYHNILPQPLNTTVLVQVAGAKIASFCDDYTSHMLVEIIGNHTGKRADYDYRSVMDPCRCQIDGFPPHFPTNPDEPYTPSFPSPDVFGPIL